MNRQLKYIIPAIAALFIGVSCEDEDKQQFRDFQKGAIPLLVQTDDDTGFIDLTDFNSSRIAFDLATEGEAPVSSVDVILTYNNSVTGESTDTKYTTVSTFPAVVSIGFEQLIAAFPDNKLTVDTLDVGDSFTVNGFVTTADGRYLEGGYSPSVLANRPVLLNYNVACASDLAGTYDFVTTNIGAGPGGDAAACGASTSGSGTLGALAGGAYTVSDATFGVFPCAWGDGPSVGVVLNDVCGRLSYTGADQYGDTYSISVVSNDGTSLVIDWVNTYNDRGRTTLTRTDGKDWPLGLH